MKTFTSIKNQSFKGLLFIAITAVLSSCGSYQQAGYYEEDGIYGASQREDVAYQDNDYNQQSGKNNYYQQYFSTKSAEIDALSKEGDIFTDIDNYTTTDSLDADGYIVYVEEDDESYGAWGTNGQDVTVNIYESAGFGWAQPFWWNGGFNYGWGWNNWGYGFNPAWNYWAWNPNFGWGFGFGWGYGYGWGVPGYGFYNNGFCWYRPAYNNYYLNGVAYNRGRRVTGRSAAGIAANSRVNTRASSRSTYNPRRSTYSRSELARRLNNTNARRANSNYSGRRNSSMNSNNRRSNRSIFNNRSSSRPNNNFNSRSNTRSSGSRMSSPRSSGSRSSGMRRSGGGSRGGGMSRGGGSRGGRGGGRGGRG